MADAYPDRMRHEGKTRDRGDVRRAARFGQKNGKGFYA